MSARKSRGGAAEKLGVGRMMVLAEFADFIVFASAYGNSENRGGLDG